MKINLSLSKKILAQDFDFSNCDFFDFLCDNPSFRYSAHLKRYYDTYKCIEKSFGIPDGKTIIEVGGASPISVYMSEKNAVFETSSDLRYSIDADNNSADVIFAFEVVEHIKDHDHQNFSEVVLFQQNGFQKFAEECHRVLKDNGSLILTTPNPNSYHAIKKSINYEDSYIFRSHVREYTRDEMIKIFSMFEETHYETRFNFFMLGPIRDQWKETFEKNDWSTDHRGDDHFMILRKR